MKEVQEMDNEKTLESVPSATQEKNKSREYQCNS